MGKASEDVANPSVRAEPPRSGGESGSSLGGRLCTPPLAESVIGGIFSPGTPKADVWGERGTVVVPRGVRWRTVEPVPTGAYWNPPILKGPFGHHHHHHHHHVHYNNDIFKGPNDGSVLW